MRLSRNLMIGILSCLLLAIISTAQIAQSTPAPTSDPFALIATEVAQVKQAKPDAFYQTARKKLGDDYYTLYRVIERLARANGLDNQPWRVAIPQTYDINAFATDINLLAFYNGLLDQIHGDPDAVSCVVGHEMAHHTQKHIPVSTAERGRILQQIRQEAVDEVSAEQADLKADLERINIGSWISGNAGVFADRIIGTGGIGGTIGNIVGGIFQNNRKRRLERAVQRIEEISATKEAKLKNEWRELSHRHELEADKFGYLYLVRAGFKPQGCVTLFSVLERLPASQISSDTHPLARDRVAAITALSSEYPTAKLVNEGKAKLAASPKPLTYERSKDGVSLRINSRSGSSDIDQRFPQ